MSTLSDGNGRASGLVDVLDRVLDKGLVVAGDIKISLAEVELLTIRIRLIVCSIDKAEQIGLDWWRYDTHLAPGRDRLAVENESLKKQIRSLERRVAALADKRRGRWAGCSAGPPSVAACAWPPTPGKDHGWCRWRAWEWRPTASSSSPSTSSCVITR